MRERGIDQLPSGKFRVRLAQRGARQTIGVADTLDEAKRLRNAAYAEVALGELVPSQGMTVAERGPSWLVQHRAHLAAYASDRQRFQTHIAESSLGSVAIEAVTPKLVRAWLVELKARKTSHKWGHRTRKPLSRQTRKHVLNLLRSFFAAAVEDELIAANPCADVKLRDPADPIPDDLYLLPEEQEALLAAEAGPERLIAAFAMGTGIRQGEQWNLHLADLRVDGADPHVFVRFGSASRTRKRKNGKTLKVALFGLGLAAAKAWLDVLPSYAPENPLGLVFPTPRGKLRGKSKVPRSWAKMRASVKRLSPHWHVLRHTCASSLIAGWWGRAWRLEEVRQMLGHSSITVTQRYAHLADSAMRDVAAETHAKWSRGGHAKPNGGPQVVGIAGYAQQESNLRHPASKADSPHAIPRSYGAHDHDVTTGLEAVAKALRAAAAAYGGAMAAASPHAHARAAELMAAALDAADGIDKAVLGRGKVGT